MCHFPVKHRAFNTEGVALDDWLPRQPPFGKTRGPEFPKLKLLQSMSLEICQHTHTRTILILLPSLAASHLSLPLRVL